MNLGLNGRGRTQPFKQAISKPVAAGPETIPHYWNPNRIGIEFAPTWFAEKVEAIDPNLSVTRNPITSKWQVWYRSPRVQHPLVQGWRLLFVQDERLDERLLARIHLIDMKNSSAKDYFDRVVAEEKRQAEAREKQFKQDSLDIATERGWDHAKIQVSGRGHSNGSKFSTFHS